MAQVLQESSSSVTDENMADDVNYENIDPDAFTKQEWKELLLEKQKDVELAAQVGAALVSENLKLNEEIKQLKDTIDTSGLLFKNASEQEDIDRDAKTAKDYLNSMESIKELTEQKKQLKAKILQLQQEFENSEQGRFALLDQFMDVSKQMEALRKEIREDAEANRTLKEMIETQKSAIAEYEQVINNQQQTILEITKQKTTLTQTLNSLQKTDNSPLAELEDLNKKLREELESAENRLLKVSEQERRVEAENNELRQLLSDKESMAEIIQSLVKENKIIKQQQEETLNLLEQSKITAKALSDRLEEVTLENAVIVTNNKDVISTKGTLRSKHNNKSASLSPTLEAPDDGSRSRSGSLRKKNDMETQTPTPSVSDPGQNPDDWAAVMHRMKRTSVRLRQDFNESKAMLQLDDFKAKSNTYNEKKQRTLRLQKDQLLSTSNAALTTSVSQLPDLPVQNPSAPELAAAATSLQQPEATQTQADTNPELESLKQMMDSLTEKLKTAEQKVEQSTSVINQKSGKEQMLDELAVKLATAENQLTNKQQQITKLEAQIETERNAMMHTLDSIAAASALTKSRQGWMYKRGAFLPTWKKRWFCLSGMDGVLYYSSNISERFLGFIELRKATIIKDTNRQLTGRDNAFVINSGGTRFMFYCDTEDDLEDWLEAISEIINYITGQPATIHDANRVVSSQLDAF